MLLVTNELLVKQHQMFSHWHLRQHLVILRRQKSREYRKKKKSEKFLKLHNQFLKLKEENSREFIRNIEDLKNCNLSQFYKKIKSVGCRQGECSNQPFSLSSHVEENLDPNAAAERIAEHFSSISKEYPPLNPMLFLIELRANSFIQMLKMEHRN